MVSSEVFLMSGTISLMRELAICAFPVVSPESRVISPAAFCERSASFLTSLATTAKPLPASPARAASMAALRARRFVWRAISSMMPILDAISRMAVTAASTASPPRSASWAALAAIDSFAAALSVFCLMVAAISSMELETSSVLAACSVAPWLMDWAVDEIWMLPDATLEVALSMLATVSESPRVMRSKARARSPSSSVRARKPAGTSSVRSPAAIFREWSTAAARVLVMEPETKRSTRATMRIIAADTRMAR